MSKAMPLRTRLLRHAEVDAATGCWLWTAWTDRDGYGRITVGIPRSAHRVAWEEFRGPIPAGLHIDHLCRNRRCINPDHMEPVTPRENTLRGTSIAVVNKVKTHCKSGHVYDEANTYRWRNRRHCRSCNRAAHERRAQRKALAS